jgi:transposase, IS30 family
MSGAEPLCAQEREMISQGLSRGKFGALHRETARAAPCCSTIAREIERNGGAADDRACAAQERYESFKARPKERKLVASSRLHDAVNEGLEQKWSPGQISARIDKKYHDDPPDESVQRDH